MIIFICICIIYYFYPQNEKTYIDIGLVLYENKKYKLQCKKKNNIIKHRIYRQFKSPIYIKDTHIFSCNELVQTNNNKLCKIIDINKKKYIKVIKN